MSKGDRNIGKVMMSRVEERNSLVAYARIYVEAT